MVFCVLCELSESPAAIFEVFCLLFVFDLLSFIFRDFFNPYSFMTYVLYSFLSLNY